MNVRKCYRSKNIYSDRGSMLKDGKFPVIPQNIRLIVTMYTCTGCGSF